MAQKGFHVNITNCIACHACEVACAQEYRLPVGVRRRRVMIQEGEAGGLPVLRHVSMACNHCDDPACLHACPVDRYSKDADTGLVLIKPSVAEDPINGVDCIGCRRCKAACPYGAPQFDEQQGVMDKCTGCHQRLTNPNLPQERRLPACAVTCTSFALHFDDVAAIQGGAYGDADALTSAPAGFKEILDPKYTKPNIRFSNKRWVP